MLDQSIIGARSFCFGAGDLVLESTVLVPNRMLSERKWQDKVKEIGGEVVLKNKTNLTSYTYDFAPNHILPKPNLT